MFEFVPYVAILLALVAALSGAFEKLLVRIGTDRGAVDEALFVMIATNVAILVPLVGVVYYPDFGVTGLAFLAFIAAGILGTLAGRLLLFTSISMIGASRSTPLVSSWALISSVLGVLFLGESLTVPHGVGIVLIVLGVAIIAWETSHENPDELPIKQLLIGISIPIGAAFFFGIEPLFAKIGFEEGTPAVVGLTIKSVAAGLGFSLYLAVKNRHPTVSTLRTRNTRWYVLAGVFGTVFFLGYYVALELAPVNIVAPIIATEILFVVVISAVFMPARLERVNWKVLLAAVGVLVGVALVTFYG